MTKTPFPETAAASEIAGLFGVSPRRVRQLAAEQHIRPVRRGEYPLSPLCLAFLKQAAADDAGADERKARAAMAAARARQIAIRNAREEGELIPTAEAVAYAQAVVGALISQMNGLPARLTRDPRERRKIEAVLDEIRNRVAAVIAEHGPAYRALPLDPGSDE